MAEGYDKPKNLEYTNPFEAWNKYMPNNIVDKFGQSKPSEAPESDDYHWREANYYGVQTKLNSTAPKGSSVRQFHKAIWHSLWCP